LKIEIGDQKVEIREENIIPSEYDDSLEKSIQLQLPSLFSDAIAAKWKLQLGSAAGALMERGGVWAAFLN